MTTLVYLDASGLVKLAIAEQESQALRLYLAGDVHIVASRMALIQAARAARRGDTEGTPHWEDIVATLSIRELDESIVNLAATLEPASLRTFAALMLGSARGAST